MIDLELGPVVGQTGGEVEIITEQVEIGKKESREWSLPEGWEEGYIGAKGETNHSDLGDRTITIFGSTYGLGSGTRQVGGFQPLDHPAVINTGPLTWSGTVILIRTA